MAAPRNRHLRASKYRGDTSSTKPRTLAKLTRPRIHAAYARERLFRTLDDARKSPVVWIAGPPGAGKTVLAATWLEHRRLPGIWYQLDSGDADPATFFYYLRQAAEAAGVGEAPLPLLTAEYREDIPGFARRWFRELFARLPGGAVLALDNYQEVAAGSILHRALAAACDDIPEDAQLLVMSWLNAPDEFSRLVAHERLTRVGPEALRLTAAEAAGIAAEKDALTVEQIRELHARCDGWAAGFTLLRERTRRTGLVNRVDECATMQEVFDYFMALVFRDVPAESRDALLETAVLPHFTDAMAIELSGRPGAASLLETLYLRHLFVERRYGTEITYEYHVLFRAFLLDQARRRYTAVEMASLSRRAAALLERAGAREDALQLLLGGGDTHGAADLLEKLSPALVAAGRGVTLRQWLATLPEPEREARPLLSYWLGTSFIGVSLLDARAAYEQAYEGFVRERDRAGQAMAVAGVLHTSLFSMKGVSARWLAILEPLFAEEPTFPSVVLAARTYGTLVGVMLWMAPAHPMFPVFVDRLERLLAEPLDDDVKLTASGHLAEYYAAAGFVREADRIIAAVEPLARSPSVSPVTRAYWCIHSSRRDYAVGELQTARAKLEHALAIVEEHHVQHGPGVIYGELADIALEAGNLEEALSILEKMRRRAAQLRYPAIVGRIHSIEAKYAALLGELDDARRHGEQACSDDLHPLLLVRTVNQRTLASVLIARGELDAARTMLDSEREFPPEQFPAQAFTYQALNALIAAARGDTCGLDQLEDGLRRLQKLGVEIPLRANQVAARPLAELLVRHRIELPYVTAWIRRVNLRPSSPDVPNWPWPVRIRTLGEFSVELDDIPLRFIGKTPRKPLELLQAIVAFGGKEVRSEALCDALWPDSDGDTAQSALRLTLSRMRKLLKHDAVVVQHQGKISLDPRLCWVDLWSFGKLCAEIEAGPPDGAAARLLEVYRGAFLGHEREEAWMLPIRDEVRHRFAAAIAITEQALESDGRGVEAAVLHREAAQRDGFPKLR